MKLAEILRKIADVVDQQEISATQPVQVRAVAQIPSHDASDNSNDDLTPVPTDVMLPPLQGKYELLKRAVGVQNRFDQGDSDPEDSNYKVTPLDAEEQSALQRMKKNAGISAFVTHELSNDEPFEG